MTPEERGLLEETYRLTQENSELLQKLYKSQRTSTYLKIAYWVVIVALSFGAYYLIQPYVDTLKGSINDITGSNSGSLFGQ